MKTSWRPTAGIQTIRKRAALLAEIRAFFSEHGVLEVDTPTLSQAAVTDPNIHSLNTDIQLSGQKPDRFYLHTSPEFAMKRLLAAGSGSIYQICKVFRAGESGRRHNPEFTLLEWYRPGFDHFALMTEIEALLGRVLGVSEFQQLEYGTLFHDRTKIDPHKATIEELQSHIDGLACGISGVDCRSQNECLDLIFSHCVAPGLGHDAPVFVINFPVCQAALAKINRAGDSAFAERFELFINGMEIANGFHELGDEVEQRKRFEQENQLRSDEGKVLMPIDERFLMALEEGLPDCAGVALGIDRLLMLLEEKNNISEVICFPTELA